MGSPKTYAVIVAAGSGTRFGSDVPKQFLDLNGVTVLQRTISAFRNSLPEAEIILVLSESGEDIWAEICAERGYRAVSIVRGGASRTDSVRNALNHIAAQADYEPDSVVMIHDGARPLIPEQMIQEIEAKTRQHSAVVPVVALTDALYSRQAAMQLSPEQRELFAAAQTPQSFLGSVIMEAYRADFDGPASDDGTMVARLTDTPVTAVPGSIQNIKITHPRDIEMAEVYLRHPVPYTL